MIAADGEGPGKRLAAVALARKLVASGGMKEEEAFHARAVEAAPAAIPTATGSGVATPAAAVAAATTVVTGSGVKRRLRSKQCVRRKQTNEEVRTLTRLCASSAPIISRTHEPGGGYA